MLQRWHVYDYDMQYFDTADTILYNTFKATDFKFDKPVPRDSPDMIP